MNARISVGGPLLRAADPIQRAELVNDSFMARSGGQLSCGFKPDRSEDIQLADTSTGSLPIAAGFYLTRSTWKSVSGTDLEIRWARPETPGVIGAIGSTNLTHPDHGQG
jgi:hypothetical protein